MPQYTVAFMQIFVLKGDVQMYLPGTSSSSSSAETMGALLSPAMRRKNKKNSISLKREHKTTDTEEQISVVRTWFGKGLR